MNNITQSQVTLLTLVNTASIIGFGVYNLKKINEINNIILEINEDMNKIKRSFMENNRRSNIVFNKLNQKIENNLNNVKLQTRDIEEQKITEIISPNNVDDLSVALHTLLE